MEEEFFVEAMQVDVVIPDHVTRCNADGSCIIPILRAERGVDMSQEAIVPRAERDVRMPQQAIISGPSTLLSTSPQVADFNFNDFETAEAHVATPAGEASMYPPTSTNMSTFPPEAVELLRTAHGTSELSSFRQVLGGDMYNLQHSLGNDPPVQGDASSGSSAVWISDPCASSQQFGDDAGFTGFTSACMMACVLGAAGKKNEMRPVLRQAASSFRQMCLSKSPVLLTAASIMLTWLLLHAEGNLSEIIMSTSLVVAQDALGNHDPICMLLEWMTAAAAQGNKLKSCFITSAMLLQLLQDFRQNQGDAHGHTIIAGYCLSFHLMFVDEDFAQAERYLEQLWTVSASVFGHSHLQTINILASLSRARLRQKKFLSALETIDKSLDEAPLGLNHPHRLELILRKALILRRLDRWDETEALYWTVVRGRVATLGLHHKATMAAHESLVTILRRNGTWDTKKAEAHNVLVDPQVNVSEYESWWRRLVEANRGDKNYERASSDEDE